MWFEHESHFWPAILVLWICWLRSTFLSSGVSTNQGTTFFFALVPTQLKPGSDFWFFFFLVDFTELRLERWNL